MSRARLVAAFELQNALTVSRNLGALSDRLPWIQRRAIQTLRRRLPVEARRDIQAEYNIGAQRVNKDLSSRIVESGIRLVAHFRGIGLRNFGARQTRRGVSAAIFRGQRRLYAHSFIATMLNNNQQVVVREGAKREMKQGRYKGKRRQPIVVKYGPTVAQMLAKGRRPERLADFSKGVLGAEVERLLAYYTRRPGGSIPNEVQP